MAENQYDETVVNTSENGVAEEDQVKLDQALAGMKESLLSNSQRSDEIGSNEEEQEQQKDPGIVEQMLEALLSLMEKAGLIDRSKEEESASLLDGDNRDQLKDFVEESFNDLQSRKEELEKDEDLPEEEKEEDKTLIEQMVEALLSLLEKLGIIDEETKKKLMEGLGKEDDNLKDLKDAILEWIDNFFDEREVDQEIGVSNEAVQDYDELGEVSSPFQEEQDKTQAALDDMRESLQSNKGNYSEEEQNNASLPERSKEEIDHSR